MPQVGPGGGGPKGAVLREMIEHTTFSICNDDGSDIVAASASTGCAPGLRSAGPICGTART